VGFGFAADLNIVSLKKCLYQMPGSGGAAASIAMALGHAQRFPINLITYIFAMAGARKFHHVFLTG